MIKFCSCKVSILQWKKTEYTNNFNQNDGERLNEIYEQLTEILDEIKSL